MAKRFPRITVFLASLTAALWAAWGGTGHGVLLSLAITASTFFYHFAMRLLVGSAVSAVMSRHTDVSRPWYQPRSWEPALYKRLRVRFWKKYLPTYRPEEFDWRIHAPEELLRATCQAEIVHEIIVPLSFLPLLAVPFAGALPVFLVTSLLAALLDLSYVVIQRYNRPRLRRLIEKQMKSPSPAQKAGQ